MNTLPLMPFVDPAMVQRIAQVLLHSLWQGAAVAAVLAVLLRLMSRSSAQTRYVTCCLALVIMAACPVVTFFRLGPQKGVEVKVVPQPSRVTTTPSPIYINRPP